MIHRLVFHAAWQAPDGRFAVTLANWTNRSQQVTVRDRRLGKGMVIHTVAKRTTTKRVDCRRGVMAITLPPISMVLAENTLEKQALMKSLHQNQTAEWSFKSSTPRKNPFNNVELSARFRHTDGEAIGGKR